MRSVRLSRVINRAAPVRCSGTASPALAPLPPLFHPDGRRLPRAPFTLFTTIFTNLVKTVSSGAVTGAELVLEKPASQPSVRLDKLRHEWKNKGALATAFKLLDEIGAEGVPSIHDYNAVLELCVRTRSFTEASELIQEMDGLLIPINDQTLYWRTRLLILLGTDRSFMTKFEDLCTDSLSRGVSIPVPALKIAYPIFQMYHQVPRLLTVFDKAVELNVRMPDRAWTTMLQYLDHSGDVETTFKFFERLRTLKGNATAPMIMRVVITSIKASNFAFASSTLSRFLEDVSARHDLSLVLTRNDYLPNFISVVKRYVDQFEFKTVHLCFESIRNFALMLRAVHSALQNPIMKRHPYEVDPAILHVLKNNLVDLTVKAWEAYREFIIELEETGTERTPENAPFIDLGLVEDLLWVAGVKQDLAFGQDVFSEMFSNNILPRTSTMNAFIEMLYDGGAIKDARRLIRQIDVNLFPPDEATLDLAQRVYLAFEAESDKGLSFDAVFPNIVQAF